MTLPIGLQLYSVRDQLAQDFDKTLETVAQAGYLGVEMAGTHGRTAQAVADQLKALGLTVVAMHTDVLTPDGLQRTIDEAAAFGCKRAVCPWRPPETFGSADGIKELAAQLNAANDTLKQHGITLLYHNHDFEMGKVDGTTGLQSLVNQLDPAIGIELDTYWVQVGGIDPVALIRDLGSRVHLIHVKDGHIDPKSPMLAVGEGKMDYAAIVAALPSSVEWLVVELDQCGTDMIEAVQKSATYLVGKGLGHGR